MQILFFAGSQLALVDFVENFVQLLPDQLHLSAIFADLANSGLLLGCEFWTGCFLHFLYFLEVSLEVLPVLCLFALDKFLLLSFLDAFLVAFHDDGDEDVLDCGVEEDHEEYEVDLSGESFSPGLQEGVVDDVSVEQREEGDDRGAGVFELVVLPEDSLPQEDEAQEERHHSQQEHQEVAPRFRKSG